MTATKDSWKNESIGETCEIPYADIFSMDDFEKIRRGLIPREMEDKWFIYCDGFELFLHRSWTGKGVFQIEFKQDSSGILVERACCAKAFADKVGVTFAAELVRCLIRNHLLDGKLPFPIPAGLKAGASGLYQHPMSSTAYAERTVNPSRPW